MGVLNFPGIRWMRQAGTSVEGTVLSYDRLWAASWARRFSGRSGGGQLRDAAGPGCLEHRHEGHHQQGAATRSACHLLNLQEQPLLSRFVTTVHNVKMSWEKWSREQIIEECGLSVALLDVVQVLGACWALQRASATSRWLLGRSSWACRFPQLQICSNGLQLATASQLL